MKKILTSAFVILVVSAVGLGATSAFFNDTETSVGNTLAAGAIDLQIDNESYAIDWNIPDYQDPIGEFVRSNHTSWRLADLTVEKFFDFVDLKPGDYAEDTISIHVDSNDAWVCAAARVTDDHDNTYVEPEIDDDATVDEGDPTNTDGELDEEVNFAFWYDDGDNVYEEDETIFLSGPISAMEGAGQIALADSNGGIFQGDPFPGDETVYIGKYWCFGDMSRAPLSEGEGNPIERGTGFRCDGSDVNNAAQTDVVVADLQFYAEQHRNNPNFSCGDWTPSWPLPQARVLESDTWSPVDFDGKEWFAKARNNNSNFELAIGTDDTQAATQDTAEAVWSAATEYPFELEYDGAGTATLTVEGETPVSFAVGTGPFGRIGINAKAPDTVQTEIVALSLSSVQPLAVDTVLASGAGGNDVESLTIFSPTINGPWTLTGIFEFSAVGAPHPQEYPAVQFSID